ncbi:prostaglandin E2 receptor EP3 subtype [Pleurodeles waltl]|uniref:prostaglandin E2 receptor EP3 subtype n=1 Tax=Pleurodeles waltl TaxID=8319 RepID=UPI003709933C
MTQAQLPCARANSSNRRMWDPSSSNMPKEKNNATKPEDCGSVSVVFPLTMMITGMVGNGLAMLLVYMSYSKKENKRKRSFLLCIGSLAMTDLTGQLLTSPIVISVYLSGRQWSHVDPSGQLCAFFGLSMTTFGLCPLFIASVMAIERTLAIRTPHWYSSHMKTGATKTVLLCIWLGALAFAMLPIAGVGQYSVQWPGTWCFISTGDTHVPGNTFFASTFASLGLLALIVTFSCNLVTIRALVARCRNKSATSQVSKQWERITMETLIQLMGIMCVLFACWSPLLIIMLTMITNHKSAEHCKISYAMQSEELQKECNFFLTAVRLASLNQILDPWVYLLLRKILLQKFCQVANAVSNCSNDGPKAQAMILTTEIKQTET